MFNCLGHQSWDKVTYPLLAKHPEFDETPDVPSDNHGIYCRSWCPLQPGVNRIVFDLMDELIDAFRADAFHVGMDEVFLIASKQCTRCRGKDPAELFARAVGDYHGHLVGERKLTMLMWGDRLLDDREMSYGEWEASRNGTAPAVDRIPKDIVICDWHYEVRDHYPSVAFFQSKGFRVWPASWKDEKAALALWRDARPGATGRMVGHLATTWVDSGAFCRALLGEPDGVNDQAKQAAGALRAVMAEAKHADAGQVGLEVSRWPALSCEQAGCGNLAPGGLRGPGSSSSPPGPARSARPSRWRAGCSEWPEASRPARRPMRLDGACTSDGMPRWWPDSSMTEGGRESGRNCTRNSGGCRRTTAPGWCSATSRA